MAWPLRRAGSAWCSAWHFRRIAVALAWTPRHAHRVPFFMDRHEFVGLSAEEAALAHLKDLKVQDRFGVRFLTYWFDEERQTAFCLAEAPDADALEAVHRASHGFMAYQIIEVDEPTVARFMGGIVEHPPGEVYVEAAFRTILFTDIVDSTSLTQRLGDAGAMAIVRAHDEIVRGALERHRGSEVKHTGDGLMAAFPSVVSAIECAVEIQRRIADAEGTGRMTVSASASGWLRVSRSPSVTTSSAPRSSLPRGSAREPTPVASWSRAPCMTLRWARASPSAAAAGYGSRDSTRRARLRGRVADEWVMTLTDRHVEDSGQAARVP